jgi:nitroreductase
MEALEAILSRRSIRKYTDKPVSDENLKPLLKAAMSAPSANNKQPWHYVIIKERETLDKIAEFHRHGKMLRQAQAAILVCGEEKLAGYHEHMIQDCSAATANMLIAAHAINLGAVWVGIYPWEDRITFFRDLFGIPDQVKPIALISLGYPAEEKPSSDRYNPDRVHYDGWQPHRPA